MDYFDLHGTQVGSATEQYQVGVSARPTASMSTASSATPTTITWTIDGVAEATASQNSLTAGSSWAENDYSYGTFHLILDLAVGGWSCDFEPVANARRAARTRSSYTMTVHG